MQRQTIQPHQVIHVNYAPLGPKPDITARYRTGYNQVASDIDIIALIENDDWYSETYLEESAEFWVETGQPDLLGRTFTRYYNIFERGWFDMNHVTRSSAMNTLIKPRLNINWCRDDEVYTDTHLWMNVPIHKVIVPMPLNCLGIKHGIGMCGGKNHVDYLHRYINRDPSMAYLKQIIDTHSFNFYETLHRNN